MLILPEIIFRWQKEERILHILEFTGEETWVKAA